MRVACAAILLSCAAVLSGCAAGGAFTPNAVASTGMPYAGLDENSYGPRSSSQFRACDADSGGGRFASLAAAAGRPAQGLMKLDATLQSLDLARAFTDPTGSEHPPVAVLSHANDGIVFWHSLRSVPLSEVASAARAYCSGLKRGVLYRGSAARCCSCRHDRRRHCRKGKVRGALASGRAASDPCR